MPTIKVRLADSTEYRLNADLHREDGPAVEYHPSGTKSWYVCGVNTGYTSGCWIAFKDRHVYLFKKLITLKSYIIAKVE